MLLRNQVNRLLILYFVPSFVKSELTASGETARWKSLLLFSPLPVLSRWMLIVAFKSEMTYRNHSYFICTARLTMLQQWKQKLRITIGKFIKCKTERERWELIVSPFIFREREREKAKNETKNIVLCCLHPHGFASLKYKLVFPYCSLWVRSGQGCRTGKRLLREGVRLCEGSWDGVKKKKHRLFFDLTRSNNRQTNFLSSPTDFLP